MRATPDPRRSLAVVPSIRIEGTTARLRRGSGVAMEVWAVGDVTRLRAHGEAEAICATRQTANRSKAPARGKDNTWSACKRTHSLGFGHFGQSRRDCITQPFRMMAEEPWNICVPLRSIRWCGSREGPGNLSALRVARPVNHNPALILFALVLQHKASGLGLRVSDSSEQVVPVFAYSSG
jgi:hypothetical protein